MFGGKVFSSADNIASESFKTFLDDAKKDGIFPLWVPYIFNGMPSFAALVSHLERMYDISHAVWVLFVIFSTIFSGTMRYFFFTYLVFILPLADINLKIN
jgi:hypothetical protein